MTIQSYTKDKAVAQLSFGIRLISTSRPTLFMESIYKKYRITRTGEVYSTFNSSRRNGQAKEYKMKLSISHYGYYVYNNSEVKRIMKVHISVAQQFIPNPENKPHVNHKNGIKTDNRVENLEWVTILENNRHAIAIGLVNRNKPVMKLSKDGALLAEYTSIKDAAAHNHCGISNISSVCYGKRKTHKNFIWKFKPI